MFFVMKKYIGIKPIYGLAYFCTNKYKIIDHEFSVTFPSNGHYVFIFMKVNFLRVQNYTVNKGFDLLKKLELKKSLIKKFKKPDQS